jgi:serine/threonine-protein kinase
VLQACVGIAEAHSRGIVHRDLKPANLFLTARPDGSALIKVLDFGIAKATNEGDSFNLTRTASVMGSPGYMSPEQLRSARDADVRSDIWALGIILFELVAHRPPFVADSLTEMALRVAMDPTPPLDVPAPPGFEQIIRRCLEKEPSARFQNVAELAHALAPFGAVHAHETAAAIARVLSVPTRPPITAPSIATTPTTISSAAGVTHAPGPSKRRIGVIAVAAIVAVVGGIVAFTAVSGGGASVPVAPATSPTPPPPPAIAPPTPAPPAIATPPAIAPPTPAPPVIVPPTLPIPTKKPTMTKKPTPTTPKDFGETRY